MRLCICGGNRNYNQLELNACMLAPGRSDTIGIQEYIQGDMIDLKVKEIWTMAIDCVLRNAGRVLFYIGMNRLPVFL